MKGFLMFRNPDGFAGPAAVSAPPAAHSVFFLLPAALPCSAAPVFPLPADRIKEAGLPACGSQAPAPRTPAPPAPPAQDAPARLPAAAAAAAKASGSQTVFPAAA